MGFIYVGGATTQTVQKLKTSNLSLAATSAGYGGNIVEVVENAGFLYIGGVTTQTVKKLRTKDLVEVAESADYGGTIWRIRAEDASFIYVSGATTLRVKKLNKSDLAEVSQSAVFGATQWAMDEDATHIYVAGSEGLVTKLNKSDLTQAAQSTTTLTGGINSLVVDGTHVYSGGGAFGPPSTYNVQRLLKSDLSFVDNGPTYGDIIQVLVDDDSFVYQAGDQQIVEKLRKTDLVSVATSSGLNDLLAMTQDTGFIYASGISAIVRKLQKSDLTQVGGDSPNYGGTVRVLAQGGGGGGWVQII